MTHATFRAIRSNRLATPATFAVIALCGALCLLTALAAGCGSQDPQTSSSPSAAETTQQAPPDTFLRGIFDDAWVKTTPDEQTAMVDDMAGELGVQVVRIDLRWSLAEPASAGTYDEAYLGPIEAAIDAARAAGMWVMIDVFGVPQWASDESFWSKGPQGIEKGYQPFYPVAEEHLADWEATAGYLAQRFKGRVAWWECWNEPNMWSYIYPQKTADDDRFAARQYVNLLERFSRAVHEADPETMVLGGVTAPFGTNDEYRTAPQRFARQLKSLGAEQWWDAYSHHPYVPASGTPMPGPLEEPRFPQYAVTLGNLPTLLEVFPGESFYLTEYGYPTQPSKAWGMGSVTEEEQATFLTQAYEHAAGFEQVKMLVWFLLRDIDKGPDRWENAFFGLERADGSRKPSWDAYRALN